MSRIEVYTKFLCPYCSRARTLLRAKGAMFEEIDITLCGEQRAEMIRRTGGRATVPQIFIGKTHVGGFDDLAELDRRGSLDALLAAG